jgi:predicted nucleic acid-binding protein
VLSNPRYGIESHRPEVAVHGLKRFRSSGHHVFWDDVVSLTDERLFNLAVVRGHAQLTDVYLLGLAHRNHGCLATFDRTIPLSAVKGAPAGALQVITPLD